MATRSEEHERTMAFAEIALGQIKALGLPAIPRNYEIFYAYATGYHPDLNQAINDSLGRSGTLSAAELGQIYDLYLSPTRLTDRIGGIGAQVVDQIDEVMKMIRATLGSASSYHESLAEATLLVGKSKAESLRQIVESLIATARKIENSNQALASQLSTSKQDQSAATTAREVTLRESDPIPSHALPIADISTRHCGRRLPRRTGPPGRYRLLADI